MDTLRVVSSRPALEWPFVNTYSWTWVALATIALVGSLVLLASRLQSHPAVASILPELRVTADAAEIISRETALGVAAQASTSHVRQGSLFTPALALTVYEIVASDFAYRSPQERAALMADAPLMTPRVNDFYPTAEGLASVPPLLLQALPPLGANLEYRFMGGHLIVRDSRTNLIVDVLPDPIAEPAATS